jgi:hypothetical protein
MNAEEWPRLSLHESKPPLPPEDGMFRQVTDVAWDKAGNTYISDGYINLRVAKVDKDGNWLKSWGEPGSGPGQFVPGRSYKLWLDGKFSAYWGSQASNWGSSDGFMRWLALPRTSSMLAKY